jgi:hypothetical protein
MNKRAYPAKDYPGILRIHHNADYRLTLHPAIWTRDYFNHYLRPGYNAWEFETVLGREARMDNNLIIAPDIPTSLWDCINVFRRGQMDLIPADNQQQEDVDLIVDAVKEWHICGH